MLRLKPIKLSEENTGEKLHKTGFDLTMIFLDMTPKEIQTNGTIPNKNTSIQQKKQSVQQRDDL